MKLESYVNKAVKLGPASLALVETVVSHGTLVAATIVGGLFVVGGPLVLAFGGLSVVGIIGVTGQVLAKYGEDNVTRRLVARLIESGLAESDIRHTLEGMPLPKGIKERSIARVYRR